MTASTRRPSVEIFSMLFCIVYVTCFYMDWAPFRYYPDARALHWRPTPQDGPAILWYGWLAAGAAVSAVVARLVPRRLAERLPTSWSWGVPMLVVVLVLIYERRWFL